MKLWMDICNLKKKYFSGEVNSIEVPGSEGRFQIFPQHAPMISTLQSGKIVYKKNQTLHTIPIQDGVVKVANNKVNVWIWK